MAKEELLKPLSLACRPLRMPTSTVSRAAALASGNGSPAASANVPLTPQPVRAAPDAARQAQYLHSHFSGLSVQDQQQPQQPHRPQSSTPGQYSMQHQQRQQQASGSAQQQLQSAAPYKPSYQAVPSPLSKTQSIARPATPTKSGPPAALGRAETMPSQYLSQVQPPAQHKLSSLSDLGRHDEALEALQAHGSIHVTRNAPVTPAKHDHHDAAAHQQSRRSEVPLLKRLFLPGAPEHEDSVPYQTTPGPAGPGIKERLKWHLRGQA
jgi:hypothetical protein